MGIRNARSRFSERNIKPPKLAISLDAMAKLTTKARNRLPEGSFALPGRRCLLNGRRCGSPLSGLLQFHWKAEDKAALRRVGEWPIMTAGKMWHNGGPMKTTHKNHPTHSEIATQAQIIWALRGRPEGQDQAIWLTAEQELRYDRKLNFAATRDRASALQHLDAKSDAVQKELSELFPSKNSPTIREELLPSSLNEDR